MLSTVVLLTKKPVTDFSKERNALLAEAVGDWVLFVDTDEVVTPELLKEAETAIQNPACQGYLFKRVDFFGGKQLRFGETARVRLLRLARKDAGHWVGKVHEVWQVKGKVGELKNPLLHYPHQTVNEFISHINHYTDLRAEEIRKFSLLTLLFYPPAKFLQNYLFRLGFLDGFPGLVMAFMMSLHSLVVRVKTYDPAATS